MSHALAVALNTVAVVLNVAFFAWAWQGVIAPRESEAR